MIVQSDCVVKNVIGVIDRDCFVSLLLFRVGVGVDGVVVSMGW